MDTVVSYIHTPMPISSIINVQKSNPCSDDLSTINEVTIEPIAPVIITNSTDVLKTEKKFKINTVHESMEISDTNFQEITVVNTAL